MAELSLCQHRTNVTPQLSLIWCPTKLSEPSLYFPFMLIPLIYPFAAFIPPILFLLPLTFSLRRPPIHGECVTYFYFVRFLVLSLSRPFVFSSGPTSQGICLPCLRATRVGQCKHNYILYTRRPFCREVSLFFRIKQSSHQNKMCRQECQCTRTRICTYT